MNRAERRRQKRKDDKSHKTLVLDKSHLHEVAMKETENCVTEYYNKGVSDAITTCVAVSLLVLNSDFGFGHNDKETGRLDKFLDLVTREVARATRPADKFCIDIYRKRVKDKLHIILTDEDES